MQSIIDLDGGRSLTDSLATTRLNGFLQAVSARTHGVQVDVPAHFERMGVGVNWLV